MVERNTHLLTWLEGGYWSCRYGSQAWAEGYLHNARDVIVDQDARIAQLERDLADIKEALELGKPFGFDPATGFIQADDGGAGDHCVFYVPKVEAERDLAEARAERLAADTALVDKYRNPKTGNFLFPSDVAAIVTRLDAAEAERDRLAAEVARLNDRETAAREFVIRHPALSLIDLAEFNAYLRLTDTIAARASLQPGEKGE